MTDDTARAYATTSRELFHGHHPMCGWTIEADPKACSCEVRLRRYGASATPANPAGLLREALEAADHVLSNLDTSLAHSTIEWAEVRTALKIVRAALAAPVAVDERRIADTFHVSASPKEPTMTDDTARAEQWRPSFCPDRTCTPVMRPLTDSENRGLDQPGFAVFCFGRLAEPIDWTFAGVEHHETLSNCQMSPLKGNVRWLDNPADWQALGSVFIQAYENVADHDR